MVVLGCPLSAAAVLSCTVQADRWISPHLSLRALFDYDRWSCCVTCQRAPLWPASWSPVFDKIRGSKSAEVQRVWGGGGVYDDGLQFMTWDDALNLDEALRNEDVSCAWDVWLSAAEAALADAYQFAGGPVPERGLVLGRGSSLVRTVRLGGPEIRKARWNFADPQEEVCYVS